MKKEKSCGMVIYNTIEGTKYYLLVKSKRHQGWGFPKGHVEANETEIETAHRELFEETGLKASMVGGFRQSIVYLVKEDTIKEVVYFLGCAQSQVVQIQEKEIAEYRWATLDEALQLLLFKMLHEVLIKADSFLESQKS